MAILPELALAQASGTSAHKAGGGQSARGAGLHELLARVKLLQSVSPMRLAELCRGHSFHVFKGGHEAVFSAWVVETNASLLFNKSDQCISLDSQPRGNMYCA